MVIKVFELSGEFAVATDDGQKLYGKMISLLSTNENIELEFEGVRVIATPFFNAAVGRLLKDLPPEDLRRRISFKNLSDVGHKVLAKVIENAKQYYHGDPEARAALDRILVDQAEGH